MVGKYEGDPSQSISLLGWARMALQVKYAPLRYKSGDWSGGDGVVPLNKVQFSPLLDFQQLLRCHNILLIAGIKWLNTKRFIIKLLKWIMD